jgi:hypothetical protein
MSDDRSERLRQRRKRSKAEPAEQSKSSKQSKPSESSEPSEPSEPSEQETSEEGESVKEEQIGTYMYLPQSQKKELERLYNILKAEYEYEYDDEFEKNRAFYPLVVQYGLDGLDVLDASEIKTRLDEL